MRKQVLAGVIGMTLLGWVGSPPLTSYAASEETKSVGTQAGETARDMKKQLETVSQQLSESAQVLAQRIEEEWRKFNEAFNQPPPPSNRKK